MLGKEERTGVKKLFNILERENVLRIEMVLFPTGFHLNSPFNFDLTAYYYPHVAIGHIYSRLQTEWLVSKKPDTEVLDMLKSHKVH